MMGRIYRGACEVLIYLGREQHDSETLPALLKSLNEIVPLLEPDEVDIRAHEFCMSDYGLPPQDDKAWLAVALF